QPLNSGLPVFRIGFEASQSVRTLPLLRFAHGAFERSRAFGNRTVTGHAGVGPAGAPRLHEPPGSQVESNAWFSASALQSGSKNAWRDRKSTRLNSSHLV